MALRRRVAATIALAIAGGFAAGVAVDRFVLVAPARGTDATAEHGDALRGASAEDLPPDGGTLAAGPVAPRPAAMETQGVAAAEDRDEPRAEERAAGGSGKTVPDAVQSLDRALLWRGGGGPEVAESGDRAAAFLEAHASRDDRDTGLRIARWLAARGRPAEAARRLISQIGRRTPSVSEIYWLSQIDPHAGVTAARTLVERKPGSPEALESLAESLAAAGDSAGAFDAYEAALRAGLPARDGASELARLEPARAIPVLLELNAGRDVGDGARALVEAYLRVGRVSEAGRELVRLATAQDGASGLILAAAILVPEETAKALAPQMDDLDALAQTDREVLMAYAEALRRVGHRAEALSVLRAVFQKRPSDAVLAEMLRCDPVASRAYVEAHVRPYAGEDGLDRIRLLGLLGRREEATTVFDLVARGAAPQPDAWAALAYADPGRAIPALREGLREARRSEPDGASEWGVRLAQALAAVGRISEAKTAWAEIPDRVLDLEALVEKAALR